MKSNDNHTVKEKSKAVIAKPFPGTLTKGVSMVKKPEYATRVSASIKGFKK
ncbi:MAG TPA: hypothetical protein VF540_00635 [Segetibacter sp.]|jgi:glutathione synthase/RimK-type ligase-like ATP-grasp enzyme